MIFLWGTADRQESDMFPFALIPLPSSELSTAIWVPGSCSASTDFLLHCIAVSGVSTSSECGLEPFFPTAMCSLWAEPASSGHASRLGLGTACIFCSGNCLCCKWGYVTEDLCRITVLIDLIHRELLSYLPLSCVAIKEHKTFTENKSMLRSLCSWEDCS